MVVTSRVFATLVAPTSIKHNAGISNQAVAIFHANIARRLLRKLP